MKAAPLLLLALLLLAAPAAQAQFVSMPAVEIRGEMAGGVHLDVRMHIERDLFLPTTFLVAGFDNTMNLTVRNMEKTWWNATFQVTNSTGASVVADNLSVSVPPMGIAGALFVVHPDEVGSVRFRIVADQHVPQTGDFGVVEPELWAVPPVSIRYLDPPAQPEEYEENGVTYRVFGAPYEVGMRPGDAYVARIEVENPLDVALPGFELELRANTLIGRVQVAPLEARERRTVEFPPWQPPTDGFGGRFFGGMQQNFQLELKARHTIGAVTAEVGTAAFRLENGAVVDYLPAYATVEVRDGVAMDVLAPERWTLGVPTRIRVNLTNYGDAHQDGAVVVTISPPHGVHYVGIQGVETRRIPLDLGIMESTSTVIEFTPRVTGQWGIETRYEMPSGSSYGYGGTSVLVPSPVRIRMSEEGAVQGRLGEAVLVDADIETDETLTDARVHVAASLRDRQGADRGSGGGTVLPGMAASLVEATRGSGTPLGTLRPGGAVSASFELVPGASGRYTVVPYVVSEGFAYTDPNADTRVTPGMFGDMSSTGTFDLVVQPRRVPSALALAPLAVGVALFVGTWTMRTRWVK